MSSRIQLQPSTRSDDLNCSGAQDRDLGGLCKGCRIRVALCPMKILKTSTRMTKKVVFPPEVIDPAKCTACKICQYYCPDFVIFIVGGPRPSRS